MAGCLPAEIIHAIVHELDDRVSLRRCSLISTTFLHPAQQCLFHSLFLRYEDIKAAHALFQSSPRLAIHVRDVKFCLEESLTQNYALVPSLLGMLSNLESLRISGASASLVDASPLTAALHDALTLPNIIRFELMDVYDAPLSLIYAALSTVTSLKVSDVLYADATGEGYETNDTILHGAPLTPRLEELTLMGSDYNLSPIIDKFMTHPGYLDLLKSLKMGLSPGNHNQFRIVVHAASRTLEHLRISCGAFLVPLELPHFNILMHIHLRIYLGLQRSLPAYLCAATSIFPSAIPHVEVIQLTFTLFEFGQDNASDWIDDQPGPLPGFASPTALCRLRRIHSQLMWMDAPNADDAAMYAGTYSGFRAFMETKLGLASRDPGLLVFSQEILQLDAE
ncbi:hypothetical protein C8J57DRAFT_1710506 [Mycena rebaudengoi]|nr:hypothetical protein C8J57DRAFT_1710506 [Mycena rebaudengoi]